MAGNTIRLHRVFSAKPDKVFRAFVDADALARWLPPNGYTAHVDELDARVGGRFRMSFTNFTTGTKNGFGGEFREIEPGKRLVYTDRFDDPALPGEILVTVTFREVMVGTEVHIVQENLPEAIPVEACYLGWQDSLRYLAKLVEPDIPE